MKIVHLESGVSYEVTEHQDNFKLTDSATHKSYFFKEAYEAIWHSIESIRNISVESIADIDLQEIAKRANISGASLSRSFIAQLKREKIRRTYYDQLFLKVFSSFRGGRDSFTISNKTNLIIDHEISYLLRRSVETSRPVISFLFF